MSTRPSLKACGNVRRCVSLLLMSTAVPAQALADAGLPTGGQVATGAATISGTGDSLTIDQASQKAILTWDSFSVDAGKSVRFNNGAGATLSRVTGNVTSRINGAVSASGSLYLVNPAGVVVGSSGSVATGGSFVASTHDITDGDFLDGGTATFAGSSRAEIINNGILTSANGDVALIARKVENHGTMTAPNGTAAMAAGYDVLMTDATGEHGRFAVRVGGSDTAVVNAGTVRAAEIEMRANGGNVYALAGNTDAVIKASGVTTTGGRIFLTAGETGRVDSAATVVARKDGTARRGDGATDGGEITITAGTVALGGRVDASGGGPEATGGTVMAIASDDLSFSGTIATRGGQDGKGGFVETSGKRIAIADTARVTTLAEGGTAGTWLIDPTDLTIADSGGDISGTTLSANLEGGNVSLSSADGATDGNGDIFVNADISWSAPTTLTLQAVRDIQINKPVSASGSGAGVTLTYGGDYSISGGSITLSGAGAGFTVNGTAYTLIRDVADLQAMANDLAGHYALAGDIDASATSGWNGGAGFDPVGNWAGAGAFTGTFTGLGHTISNLTINRPSQSEVGLFGTAYSGSLRDVTLSDGQITGGGSVGALAGTGSQSLKIKSVTSSAAVNGMTGSYTGGLVGYMGYGSISLSSTSGPVTAEQSNIGGLVGTTSEATITQSHASGSVTNTGTASGSTAAAGGLVGLTILLSKIDQSYATGNVTSATSRVGGLVGVNGGEITNSYATGSVTSTDNSAYISIGGLAGDSIRLPAGGLWGSIKNSYATGALSAPSGSRVGGIAGHADSAPAYFSGNYWNMDTTGVTTGIGHGGSGGVTGLTTAQMQAASSFAGWDIATVGGSGAMWRLYEGATAPLLRAFLTPLTVTGGAGGKTYDGATTSTNVGTLTYGSSSHDSSLILGTATYTTSSANAGTYSGGGLSLGGLYSTQQGYDLTITPGTLTINKAPLTVSANSTSKTYDGAAFSGNNGATYAGFVNGEGTSVLGGSLAYGGTAQGAVNAGAYSITASGLAAANYTITYADGTLTVDKAPLSVTAGSTSKTYDGAAFSGGNGVTYAGFVNGEGTSVLGGTLAYGGTAQGAVNAGRYSIAASGLTAANYTIAYTDGTLTVGKAPLTVTAGNTSKTYDGVAFSGGNGVTYAGFVNGEGTSVLGGTLAYGGTAQGAVNAGRYSIAASGLTAANYTIAYTDGTLTVGKAPLTVTAGNTSKTYDGVAFSGGNGVTYAGFVNGETASVLGGRLTYGGAAQGAVDAGSYAIAVSGLTAANYDLAYADGILTVDRAGLTVTANDAAKTFDGTAFSGGNGVTYSGFVGGESASVLGGSLVYGGAAQGAVDVGRYGLSASGLTAANYHITYTDGTLTVAADESQTQSPPPASPVTPASTPPAGPAVTMTVSDDWPNQFSPSQNRVTPRDASAITVGTCAAIDSLQVLVSAPNACE